MRICVSVFYIEGSRPEWCMSSMIHNKDTPFWSGTLDIVLSHSLCAILISSVYVSHLCTPVCLCMCDRVRRFCCRDWKMTSTNPREPLRSVCARRVPVG